jgi:hypothetical protein
MSNEKNEKENPFGAMGDFLGGSGNSPGKTEVGTNNATDILGGALGGLTGGSPTEGKNTELSGLLSLKSSHNKYVSAQPQGSVECNRDTAGGWEKFTAEPLDSGKYALKSCHSRYLSAQPDGSVQWNREKVLEWETWTVEQLEKGIALKSAHDRYLSAQPDGKIYANGRASKEWETFTVIEA